MQAVTDNFKAAVNAATRNLDVVVKLIGKGETDYTNARIYSSKDLLLSLKIVDGQTTGGFGLGGTICPSLTAELHKTAVVSVGDKVKAELIVYNGGGNLTIASEFTVDNIKRKADGSLSVTALGNMIKLAKNYVSELSYPTTQLAVLEEIAAQSGYELHPLITNELINNPQIQSAPVKGTAEDGTTLYYTRREMLGYAAAINGGAAYISQYGYIGLARHNDTGETFTHERVFQETITEPFEITSVKWNSTGLSYSLGDDYDENTIEFYNPLVYNAREQIAHNLETDLIGFGYDGAIIKKQGCGYFEVGDIVHYSDISGTTHDLLVLGIVYEFVNSYFTETLYSLASTATQREYAGNEVVSNQIGGGQAQPSAPSYSGGPLEKYEYISDLSAKCNGVTYTAEKDADTGLISKITDDKGGELVPDAVGAITDVSFHNAVLLAVALARGLKSAITADPLTPMCEYRYNNDSMVQNGSEVTWQNQVIGNSKELVMSDAVVADGGIYLGNESSKGTLLYENTAQIQEYTIYLVVNANRGHRIFETTGSGNNNTAICFWGDTGIYRTTACISGSEIKSDVSSTTKAVLAVVKHADGGFSFYANGVLAGTKESGGYNLKSGEICFSYSRLYGKSAADFYFYDFALAESAHSEADIITNSRYLMAKYGIA